MKNSPTLKSSNIDSPKTPGGISKSLLTPCRRVGLSRNFRRNGASPFQSPLAGKIDVKQEKPETRKRKEPLEESPLTHENTENVRTSEEVQTPVRKVELPRRKRSKVLLTSISRDTDKIEPPQELEPDTNRNNVSCKTIDIDNTQNELNNYTCSKTEEADTHKTCEKTVTPLKLKIKSQSKKNGPSYSISKSIDVEKENLSNNTNTLEDIPKEYTEQEIKCKSPNDLTKECIVVIQKKIFKTGLQKQTSPKSKLNATKSKIASQAISDSDSDDAPLISFNKNSEMKTSQNAEDQDFAPSIKVTSKPVKTKSKTKLKSPSTKTKTNTKEVKVDIHQTPNQVNSDDDDEFFEKKKTILIRKTYDKVIKPSKAKSTGSITQKDIDELKARIERKKKMLLAQATTEDTKELRDLIKKWQKGCQDALMELMDLMKSKFPEKQNMDYSEILQSLKIPSTLVGYDSDNDCFLTPDDENVILANV